MKTNESFEGWFKDQSAKHRKLISRLRVLVSDVAPKLTENSKWGNGVWLKVDLPVIFVHTKPDHIQFGFFAGAGFSDPKNLLRGKGKWVRHIRVETIEDIDEAAFSTLIRKAVRAPSYKKTS